MNINLTPSEIVYLYETLLVAPVSNSEQQDARSSIVSKAKEALLAKLEISNIETNRVMCNAWVSQETKKLEDLNKKNKELKDSPHLSVKKTKETKDINKKRKNVRNV